MSKRFQDKVAWITGGGTGIGKALALALAAEGARVAISGRRLDRLQGAVAELEAAGAQALAVACDVTDEAAVAAAVQQVVDHFGGLDICVANAGFAVAASIEAMDAEDWHRQLNVNVIGAAVTARHALPHLRKTKGRMAFVGSVAGYISAPKMAAYNASKAAVRAINDTLAAELAGTGVSSTGIYPGFIASEIYKVGNDGQHNDEIQDRRPKNLIWPADKAAAVMLRAIHKRKRDVVVTGHGQFAVFLARHWPWAAFQLMSSGPKKKNRRIAAG